MIPMIRVLTLLCAAALPVLTASAGLGAQQRVTTLQQEAQRRFAALHERMQSLQVVKAEAEPDEARVLASGNRFIQERQIHDGMAQVAELLGGARYDEALARMDQVQQDMQHLLDLLLDRDLDLDRLLAEIERLAAYQERVDELLAQQRAEKDAAVEAEALQARLAALAAARAEAEQLLGEQKELRAQAEQAGAAAPADVARAMTERERALKERAEALGDRLEPLDEPREDAPAAGETPPSEPAAGGEPGTCAGACKGAAGAMGRAEQSLQKNQPERALEDMDAAIRELEAAVQRLDELRDEAGRRLQELPFEQQAKAQEQTAIDTDHVAKDMEAADREAQEQGDARPPTPGKRNVQQAVPKQKAAAGQLKEYVPGDAKQQQQDAVEELEKAKQALEDALAQLRQQLQDEVLRALEERFGAMLEKQKELSARTKAADRIAAQALVAAGTQPAQVVERARAIAGGEHELAGEANDALSLLQEEGSTAAFPAVVELLRDDLTGIAGQLEQVDTGESTQTLQAEVEQTLKDLIDALRRQIEMNAGQGGSCMCNGQPVLVPYSAELKLVMIKQKHVNRRTQQFDAQVPAAERDAEAARDAAAELSRQQGLVEDLLRRMATKIEKDAQGAR